MSVVINDSDNIAVLDSRIIASLCEGTICVDLSPTTYIGSGSTLVRGANVQVKNPFGVIVKPYGANYEIAPDLSGGMDAPICISIPTQAGAYQWGTYIVDVTLYDEDGTPYTVTKSVKICAPDTKNKQKNFAILSAKLLADCSNGVLTVITDTPPNYNGTIFQSQDIDLTLEYPTSSGLPVLAVDVDSFSVQLFEGVYKLTGTICVRYNVSDSVNTNVYVDVLYKIKLEKNVRCLIDECCVFTELANLNAQLLSNCSNQKKEEISNTIFDVLRLLKTAQLGAQCGEDPSQYIEQLEKLLGCSCTCNCAEGTPIINNTPVTNFTLEGCNVTKQVIGQTTKYTINAYEYIIEVANNGGVLVITAPTLDDCTKTQTITFNIAAAYSQIKTLANQNNTEGDFWASVVNKGLRDVDPSCLGVADDVWASYTLKQRFDAVIAKVCGCCGCDGTISDVALSHVGADVNITFDVSASVLFADIYLDGEFKTRKFITSNRDNIEYTFVGAADGLPHSFTIIPVCANSSIGTMSTTEFTFLGCPDVEPPSLSQSSVTAECPFDLTTIPASPPVGITVEWHNANNTLASSLVGNPAAVNSGTYYAFSKNADGCYSESRQFVLSCETDSSCSAPQTLSVDLPTAGNIRILFQSAAFPPPGNSYTVKRRLASDPDIDGSYTTIGSPVWNASLNRWQIFDTSYTQNTLYVYKAQSNCGDSPATTPSVTYTFADISCAQILGTVASTTQIDYSLDITGFNSINKYKVELYDNTGTILIETQQFTPAFSNPITGSFTYLTPGTCYKIKVTACIDSFCKTSCSIVSICTPSEPAPGNKNVFVVNETGAAIQITTDNGTFNFASGVNGNIVCTDAGFVRNDLGSHSYRFLTTMPSTDDPDESPNPETLGAGASHTLNASIANLNYIRVS